MSDTVFALATPPGRAGLAVIRVSGSASWQSAKAVTGYNTLSPRHARLCKILDPVSRETLDRSLVLPFRGPASFTGEDVVEYHLHGSPAVVDSLLDILAAQEDHRLAEPGEFTRRAFENGKLDLTEAEAVADLINAETQLQRQQALAQMGGALSTLYDSWADELKKALAYIEAQIDFADEELDGDMGERIYPVIEALQRDINAHLNDNRRGERVRSGIHVAVIGAPNAGKSSLVNALARRDVAIVSEHAGTTRDIIEVYLDLAGYPVIIADTAGLRPEQLSADAQGAIESEGIKRALKKAGEADIRLLMFDATAEMPHEPTMALADENALIVYNKADCEGAHNFEPGIMISVKTGAGIDDLTQALINKIKALLGTAETPALTRKRHRAALETCCESLHRAAAAPEAALMAEDVRLAMRALGRITGRVDVEDLLDVIFRDFCIGK